MFVDAHADGVSRWQADVCVVGAGAAGITLALALAERGLDVCLVESGGLTPDADTQALYDGVIVGEPYDLAGSRVRYFGGSTNHWGGMCRVFDEEDFLPRDWIPHSGWPIRKRDIDPYYDRAHAFLELPLRRPLEEVEERREEYPRLLGPVNAAFDPILCLKSPPTRMGSRYRDDVARRPRITCVLGANVVRIIPNADGTAIVELDGMTLGGRRLTFVARDYVLSTGAVENARLLLASDSVIPGGIGNRHDLVGRYFQDHPNYAVADMIAAPAAGTKGFQEEYLQDRAKNGLAGVWDAFFGFRTTLATCAKHRLLGCGVYARRVAESQYDAATEGVAALVNQGGEHADWAPAHAYRINVIAEQAPTWSNRVYLSHERDALGQRKVAIDIRLAPIDVRSITKTVRLFGLEVAKSGRGRVRERPLPFPRRAFLTGHQIGTTRMSDDPASGVTDRDGKVHGIANLYVSGSSLFPTGGTAGPTLTIVALALRQADGLAQQREAWIPEVRG